MLIMPSSSTAVSLLALLNVGVTDFSGILALRFDPPLGGEGGGGIAIADGMRAVFGVVRDGRPPPKLLGVPRPIPRLAPFIPASEPLVEGLAMLDECDGLAETTRAGLAKVFVLEGLANAPPRADNCDAVTPMYLLALLPAVILLIADAEGVVALGIGALAFAAADFGRTVPGVVAVKP
jgi:hypothetical protein